MSNIPVNRLDKPFLHVLKQKYPCNRQIMEICQHFKGDFKAAVRVLLPNADPEKEWHRLKLCGIGTLSIDEPEFPSLLRHCYNPPLLLYYIGNLGSIRHTTLAFVGSRTMSNYGERLTSNIINGLKGQPVTIVSGLAVGIDSAAHRAAIQNGTPTIAVLGSGLNDNNIYPAVNLPLAKEIINNGGLLISEFPPGTKSLRHHFPLRNRIIAGISQATVVIEAANKSGALITARIAAEENRDVFAVPGSIFEPQSEGTNTLISNGAIPLLGAEDLIQYLTNLNSTG